jgi:glycosyltransferase involved in cell wall biosynthesis
MTSFGFVSSYPPTRCGLATFTESLATAMVATGGHDARVVRVLDEASSPSEDRFSSRTVIAELVGGDPSSVDTSARALNGLDIVVVQHEYGIYGGPDGDEVIGLLSALTSPTIVVLHTVLEEPTASQRAVLERVVELATSVVVMTTAAHEILARRFSVDMSKVSVIPHGVASSLSSMPGSVARGPARGRRVLTWGLIGPGKGLEWGIRAMAELRDLGAEYLIVGKTHPKVVMYEGEAYRERLQALVAELGLTETVSFVNTYPDRDELADFVASADVVLLPYDSRDQVTSGVLVEAVSAGKPVVATAFPHAVELLSSGAGLIVEHENPFSIARALRDVLEHDGHAAAMADAASRLSHDASWVDVAGRYRALADSILAVRAA